MSRGIRKYLMESTYEECLAAVRENGLDIDEVPFEFRIEEMCMAAVKENGYAFAEVVRETPYVVTAGMCDAAVWARSGAIQFVPEKFLTLELCIDAVLGDKEALLYIPEEFMTEELCKIAVRQNSEASVRAPIKMWRRLRIVEDRARRREKQKGMAE